MEIIYDEQALADLDFWKQSGNKAIQKKIFRLIESIEQTRFEGIGKPEALKYELSGKWSRRINEEHRIVYIAMENAIKIYSLRGHYDL